jgi:hypothetical protein
LPWPFIPCGQQGPAKTEKQKSTRKLDSKPIQCDQKATVPAQLNFSCTRALPQSLMYTVKAFKRAAYTISTISQTPIYFVPRMSSANHSRNPSVNGSSNGSDNSSQFLVPIRNQTLHLEAGTRSSEPETRSTAVGPRATQSNSKTSWFRRKIPAFLRPSAPFLKPAAELGPIPTTKESLRAIVVSSCTLFLATYAIAILTRSFRAQHLSCLHTHLCKSISSLAFSIRSLIPSGFFTLSHPTNMLRFSSVCGFLAIHAVALS